MNFLTKAVNDLTTYFTPKEVVKIVEKEKIKSIIGNPPFSNK